MFFLIQAGLVLAAEDWTWNTVTTLSSKGTEVCRGKCFLLKTKWGRWSRGWGGGAGVQRGGRGWNWASEQKSKTEEAVSYLRLVLPPMPSRGQWYPVLRHVKDPWAFPMCSSFTATLSRSLLVLTSWPLTRMSVGSLLRGWSGACLGGLVISGGLGRPWPFFPRIGSVWPQIYHPLRNSISIAGDVYMNKIKFSLFRSSMPTASISSLIISTAQEQTMILIYDLKIFPFPLCRKCYNKKP